MSIDTDYEVLRKVLAENDLPGWAVEFGVYSGYSLDIIAERMPVIGLDSFEGLPEDWRPGFPKGKFRTPYPENVPANAMLVHGWFEDTLPVLRERGIPQIGLIHIDCDLYSSTVTALNGMIDYMHPGTVVVFDEYHGYPGSEQHEEKAWQEFIATNLVTAEMILSGEQEAAFVIHDIGARR